MTVAALSLTGCNPKWHGLKAFFCSETRQEFRFSPQKRGCRKSWRLPLQLRSPPLGSSPAGHARFRRTLPVLLKPMCASDPYQIAAPGTDSGFLQQHVRTVMIFVEAFAMKTNCRQRQLSGNSGEFESWEKRDVSHEIEHLDLPAILSVGYRVRGDHGTQFRQWATMRLSKISGDMEFSCPGICRRGRHDRGTC